MLKLVSINDPILRQKAKDVEDFSKIETLAWDMYEVMISNKGVGLAAPQVGRSIKLFVTVKTGGIDMLPDNSKRPLPFSVFINPLIQSQSKGLLIEEEGCLSIPNKTVQVPRPHSILFEADNLRGSRYVAGLNGILARVFCHEYDHLFGKLITDYV